jgi:aminoglycoside phosphotransferase (APT) family kinase protein
VGTHETAPPGRFLAEGRSAVVYDLGDGRLLRRFRDTGADATREAAVLALAARHGVPVPEVYEAAGPDVVLEHVRGPSMLTALLEDPSTVGVHGRMLAELHDRLDRVAAPADWYLPVRGERPGRLVHGDLHPGNVVLSSAGPVLIDWTNAATGHPACDTATTWLVLACLSHPDPVVDARIDGLRRPLLDAFLPAIDRAAAARTVPYVAADRIADPATTDAERARIEAFVAEVGS